LLGEDTASVAKRATETYDRAASPFERRIVIYGAGGLGQRVLAGLRANGWDALAFADRAPASWSREIGGLPVLSPEDAVRQYGLNTVFVVAVWHPVVSGGIYQIVAGLKAMGCLHVVPFVWLYWKFPETFLPYYLCDLPVHVLESADEVRRAYDLFSGIRSQKEFLRQLEFRLTGDFGCLTSPDRYPQYFPDRLFRPREDECFVDCGAFNGDSLVALADWTRGRFQRAVAFEADPENFASLNRTVEGDDRLSGRVRAIQQAVGLEKRLMRFAASGFGSAAISASGTIDVDCSPLDETIAGERPTYIKMDIEGAEMDALTGAANILARDRPTLAICSYHLQDHLWGVPRRINDLMPGTRLLLRPHRADGFDLVCYAVPFQGREFNPLMEDSD
jgi:FkbM family methyltransferase